MKKADFQFMGFSLEELIQVINFAKKHGYDCTKPVETSTLSRQVDGAHYEKMGIQPWEIIAKNGLDFWEGSALAYLLRWKTKDGLIDLDKAIHYIDRIKELAKQGYYGDSFKDVLPSTAKEIKP